jgi:hypothetical protein
MGNSPPFHTCRAACFALSRRKKVNRWTGDVFGVYPLYDVYDNPHRRFAPLNGACSGRNLNSFLRMDALEPGLTGVPSSHSCDRKDRSKGNGGAGRDRTDDLKLAKLPLSQLSYSPFWCSRQQTRQRVVGLGRLELPTSPLSRARSNQLSYRPVECRSPCESADTRKSIHGKKEKRRRRYPALCEQTRPTPRRA